MPSPESRVPSSQPRSRRPSPKAVLAAPERGVVVRFGATLAATGLALAVTLWLAPFVQTVRFVFFWPAVIFSAWFGGRWPGILASLLAVLAVDYALLAPANGFQLTDPHDLVPLGAFVAGSIFVSSLTEALRRERRRAAEAAADSARLAAELEAQAMELEQQVEESQALSEELEQSNQELAQRTAEAETAREAAERAEEASRYLTRASDVLASSIDYEVTLADVARLVVPDLADWCVVHVVDERGSPRQLAVAHVDPAKVAWARAMNERYPPDPDAPTGVPNVLRTGKPELYAEIPDAMLEAGTRDAEHLRMIRALGLRSAMIVPLIARERTLGTLSLVAAESGRRYGDADLALAMELAWRAALAVDNARLYHAALEARRAAEEASLAKTQFLAVMSHELRTPLNAIAGYAQLIEMGVHGQTTARQREALSRLLRSQRHLLSLINDVLNYARLEAGRVDFHLADVAVHDVLAELEPLVAPLLAAKEQQYVREPCAPGILVRADAEKLLQILLNLLSNAVKFTPPRGRITLSCAADGRAARIVVRDTGIGIPAEKLGAIFEPFVQLDRRLTSRQEGTGLGLAISRDLAHGMDGDLTAESEVGVGSAFTLTLRTAGDRR